MWEGRSRAGRDGSSTGGEVRFGSPKRERKAARTRGSEYDAGPSALLSCWRRFEEEEGGEEEGGRGERGALSAVDGS